jgi:hypothetical protein
VLQLLFVFLQLIKQEHGLHDICHADYGSQDKKKNRFGLEKTKESGF